MPHVRVEVVFSDHDAVPADVIVSVIRDIERIAHATERDALEVAVREARQQDLLTQVEADAIQLRFDQLKGSAVVVRGVERGSLELTLLGGALALWIIKNTVGETFKRAYDGSNLDQLLERVFTKSLDGMAGGIRSALGIQSDKNERKLEDLTRSEASALRIDRKQSAKWITRQIDVAQDNNGNVVVRASLTYEETSIATSEYIRLLDESDQEPPAQTMLER